jgi:hypothetical protein
MGSTLMRLKKISTREILLVLDTEFQKFSFVAFAFSGNQTARSCVEDGDSSQSQM